MNIQELNINWYTRYNEYDETNKQKNIISIINNIKSEEKILGIKLLDSFFTFYMVVVSSLGSKAGIYKE